MPQKGKPFRVGRVRGYLRGRVWYLCYWENGKRRRPRVGTDRGAAKRLAAEVNSQLEAGEPSVLSFEKVTIPELRRRWLDHHENVRRSSVHTVRRYRAATDHLLRFVDKVRPVRDASLFRTSHAEELVAYLRKTKVAPNGHPHSEKRRLLDKGVSFIAEACRAMFSFAARHRHLSPYGENAFAAIEIDRMPVDDAKPIVLFTADQEAEFLRACDGWQVKTRAQREIPILPVLGEVLRSMVGTRTVGPVFLRRGFSRDGSKPGLNGKTERELQSRTVRPQWPPGRGWRRRLPRQVRTFAAGACEIAQARLARRQPDSHHAFH